MAKPWLRWSKVRYEQRCLAAAIKPSSCVVAWLQLRDQRRMATGFQRRPFWPNLKQRLLLRESGKRALASEVSDGAYDTKACHAAIAQRNAQAVITPRKNAQTWKATLVGAHARNEALRACDRLGRLCCTSRKADEITPAPDAAMPWHPRAPCSGARVA